MLEHFIGPNSSDIAWWQMTIRAAIIFFLLFLVRIGGKRAFGKTTAFDIVLGVLLGSALSRSLTGNAPLLPTLAASGSLVLLHFLVAKLALNSQRPFGDVIAGLLDPGCRDGACRTRSKDKNFFNRSARSGFIVDRCQPGVHGCSLANRCYRRLVAGRDLGGSILVGFSVLAATLSLTRLTQLGLEDWSSLCRVINYPAN